MSRRIGRCCGLALCALLVTTSSALGAAGFEPTLDVPVGTGLTFGPNVAVNDSGAAAVAYLVGPTLKVASRKPGAAFSDTDTIGPADTVQPHLVVDPDDTTFVVYVAGGALKWAKRPPG